MLESVNMVCPGCIWIVVPYYNEGTEKGALKEMAPVFLAKLQELKERQLANENSRMLFVDDGSSDDTWEVIEALAAECSSVVGIRLSRNRGHQNALLAGLMQARACCDAAISMDCDGQDDISAVDEMLIKYYQGSDIVYGVRSDRESDSWFKRETAVAFYKILSGLGVETIHNHADYRLMDKEALNALAQFPEVNLYLRGMVPLVGFSSSIVYYKRSERVAGKSHYPLKKMIALALNGVTSLSVKPLRFISLAGVLVSFLSLLGVLWAIVVAATGGSVSGWASLVCIVGIIGGMQLLCLGVIGEYIGKIFLEVKRRPRYIIAESAGSIPGNALLRSDCANIIDACGCEMGIVGCAGAQSEESANNEK